MRRQPPNRRHLDERTLNVHLAIGGTRMTGRAARRVRLQGARVLLTGASSGIGRALAHRLAAQGAELVIAARRAELLESLSDEVAAAGHSRPHWIPTDLGVPGAAAQLGGDALQYFGQEIDVVINNAGASLIGAQVLIGDNSPARTVYEVNFWTPLALSAALIPGMVARGSGTIVNVTSTIQSVPLPMLGGYYGSSKAALAQATRALRLELVETPIRVIEVVPGATDTALRDVDELPWKDSPPRTLRPVSPESTATAIVHGLARGKHRIVYPSYSVVPLEIPAVGQLVARVGGRRVDTQSAIGPRMLNGRGNTR